MEYFGNKNILKHYKTGFLSSRKCPAEVVLKSYEWAKRQRTQDNCVICGNHSQIERDIFEILLKGDQPLVLVLPRGLKKRWDTLWLENVEKDRLLIISPFPKEIKRVTRETAIRKNETILSLSDKIVVGYKSSKGQLDRLLTNLKFDHV
ncbi:MAG: DNA-binding protein [Bacteroidetes bacterium RIFCSPHIGHO2_02_FULL_44_7]|nr:MAG: DNA-binding protein [Bacteroidetes bacterium RIFCSPHIGHO2_02_FULL_44_7]